MADQLIRETRPPAGTPKSPVPQYWNPETGEYEKVEGTGGAPRAVLLGPNGQPISTSNRLPVEAEVTGDVTVTGAVEATLSGSKIQIGSTEFDLHPDGNTVLGLSADKPSASSLASALRVGAVYHSVDTGEYEETTGTAWRDLL